MRANNQLVLSEHGSPSGPSAPVPPSSTWRCSRTVTPVPSASAPWPFVVGTAHGAARLCASAPHWCVVLTSVCDSFWDQFVRRGRRPAKL